MVGVRHRGHLSFSFGDLLSDGKATPSSRRCSAASCPASLADALEGLLGVFVALVGGLLVPAGGLLKVLLHAPAVLIPPAQVVLREGDALIDELETLVALRRVMLGLL